MRKVLGLTLALLFTLTLSAAAQEAKGKIKTIDRADHSFTLEDGSKFWVSDSQLSDLSPGEQVQAVYETQGGKRVVTDLQHRTMGSDGQETTNFGTNGGTPADSIQAGD